ncbi:hypothetical protein RB595_003521 [Gaeumannomyces hyphopodioides]
MSTRPVKSCTECKQAKLRCDSKDRFPNSCSRCHARQLLCTVDTAFKRTPARRRLQALNQELQTLRRQHQSHGAADLAPQPSEVVAKTDEAISWDAAPDSLVLDSGMLLLDGSAQLPATTAVEAFTVFVNVFRPQMPILGPISMRSMHQSQPLLFWTIVVVVATHSPSPVFDGVLELLRRPYEAMIQRQVLQSPLPLHGIQVLLLLCQWPLPCDKQSQDPSWLYCGLAVHGGRFMGLDRHHQEQQTAGPPLASLGVSAAYAPRAVRVNTWLACFAVSASLGMHLGLPPPIDSDLDLAVIYAALPHAPATFASHVKIQTVAVKFLSLLNHDIGSPALSSILSLADAELEAAKKETYPTAMGAIDVDSGRLLELTILSVKIHLYALVLAKPHHNLTAGPGQSMIHVVLSRALDVAIRFIDLSTWDLRNIGCSEDGSPTQQHHPSDAAALRVKLRRQCLPKNHFRCLALATAILLMFLYKQQRSPDDSKVDELRGDLGVSVANRIAMAQRFVKACARHDLDEFGRMATVFEALAAQQQQQTRPEGQASTGAAGADAATSPRLQVTQRMGVSILLDSITRSHQVRGKAVHVEDEASSLNEMEQTFSQVAIAPPAPDDSWGQIVDLDPMWGLPNGPFSSILDMDPAWFDMEGPGNSQCL